MKKIYLLTILFSLISLCSCNIFDDLKKGEQPNTLEGLLELNGPTCEYIFELRLGIVGDWWIEGKSIKALPNGKPVVMERAIHYGTLMVGMEFESEEVAERVVKAYNAISYSYYRKGKYVFQTYFGCFAFFYCEEYIRGNAVDGYWINDIDNGKKILCTVNQKLPVDNGVIIVDGYDILIHQCLSFHEKDYFKKVVIGEDVEMLYYGALCSKNFEVLEFSGDIKEIHGGMLVGNKTFKYTVIPSSVTYVGKKAFTQGNIYCEHSEKPKGWDVNFAVENAKVYWAGEWEYDENGVPHPIEKVTSDNITEEV